MKRLLGAFLIALLAAGVVSAQIAIPNTLTSGTTITAGGLNTNFSTLGSHSLDRLSGGTISGNVAVDPGITIDGIDIGATVCVTCAPTFKDLTLASPATGLTVGGNVIINTTGKIPALTSTYFTSLAFDAANLTGTVNTARLGTGSASSSNFLRGDGTWASVIAATEFNIGTNVSGAQAANFATNGPLQKVTRNGAISFTLTAPASPGTVVLRIIHDASGTSFAVTFTTTVKWPNGVVPAFSLTTANAVDIVTLYWDGAVWYGVQSANFS